jgi:hypothetical protein
MSKSLQLARPMMRRGARLDADQARRQLLEERDHVPALKLAPDNDATERIDAMNLKN